MVGGGLKPRQMWPLGPRAAGPALALMGGVAEPSRRARWLCATSSLCLKQSGSCAPEVLGTRPHTEAPSLQLWCKTLVTPWVGPALSPGPIEGELGLGLLLVWRPFSGGRASGALRTSSASAVD